MLVLVVFGAWYKYNIDTILQLSLQYLSIDDI